MNQAGGLALICDAHGSVTKVMIDSLGLGVAIQPGMPFARLAAPGGLAKALSFVTEINAQVVVFDWEINLAIGEQVKTLHFTGSKTGEGLLIVGAENGKFALKLFEEMMQINNEQANALRAALKDQSRDQNLFDEISRLNNELVSTQRELAKKNAELERLNQEKNRFLGMAAHDLRNPLHAILSHSEFLLDEDPLTLGTEYREFMQVIHASSDFMARLVDDLLNVARIEAGQLNLDYAAVDLSALIARDISINRALAAKKQIEIEMQAETLPKALVDSGKMDQVLNNLLGNAIKFSPAGSRIEVRLAAQAGNFVLSVQDWGTGIRRDEIDQLFTPFRPGQRGTQGEKSTGLGLAIVKRIVEGHGGKIWLESQVGQGTTFFVSIPFEPPEG